VVFASGLDAFSDQSGELGGHLGLPGNRKFVYKKEQELGLVRELLC